MAKTPEERKSEIAERKAFQEVKTIMGNPVVFAEPAGSATGFPDFGFSVEIDGKSFDLFFEFKDSWKTQMGSMRNWIYKPSSGFSVPSVDAKDENKQLLLEVMNNTPRAKTEAKRLLDSLKKYFDPRVQSLSSGVLAVESDKQTRKLKTQKFVANTDNYQIAKIRDYRLGAKILDHYKKKFRENIRPNTHGSVLFMLIDDTIWFVEDKGMTKQQLKKVFSLLGKTDIPQLDNLEANLECRIQPRYMDIKKSETARMDVLAAFRLARKPSGGVKIL